MNTLKRIVAATDFSAAGHAALARAAQLAVQQAAELHVLHATPDWNLFSNRAQVNQKHYDEITDNADAMMKREVGWLLAEYGISARGGVHRGKASQTIARAIEAHHPNLVVIGARGEHAPLIAPAALGGTTLKLITHTTVPLLLVREPVVAPYSICLAAVANMDEQSRAIIEYASALVHGGHCHVVSVYEVPYVERLKLCGVGAEAISHCIQEAEKAAAAGSQPSWAGTEPPAQVDMHLVRGTPIPAILTEITRYSPQFIAVGRHRRTGGDDRDSLLGCIGTRLAYHAPVDVLMIP